MKGQGSLSSLFRWTSDLRTLQWLTRRHLWGTCSETSSACNTEKKSVQGNLVEDILHVRRNTCKQQNLFLFFYCICDKVKWVSCILRNDYLLQLGTFLVVERFYSTRLTDSWSNLLDRLVWALNKLWKNIWKRRLYKRFSSGNFDKKTLYTFTETHTNNRIICIFILYMWQNQMNFMHIKEWLTSATWHISYC